MASRRKKSSRADEHLSARARQVMDILYRLGEATANEVLDAAGGDIPSYSAVRSILRQLETKGLVSHAEKGLRYVYRPRVSRTSRSRSALVEMLDTFFDGSAEKTMQALLDLSAERGSSHEVDLDRLEKMIRQAKKEGR